MYEIIDDCSGVQICVNQDISSLFKKNQDNTVESQAIQF